MCFYCVGDLLCSIVWKYLVCCDVLFVCEYECLVGLDVRLDWWYLVLLLIEVWIVWLVCWVDLVECEGCCYMLILFGYLVLGLGSGNVYYYLC